MLSFSHIDVKHRLNDVSGKAKAGQFVHVMGTNGSGKSSLLHALAGLLSLDKGNICLNGQDLQHYSLPQLATIRCLQEQQQQSSFALSVAEVLHFFSAQHGLPDELERALELNDFLQRPLNQLSGGEVRRVHIARALLQIWPAIESGKALILLDEPNQGLDFKHQHLLFQLLAKICQNNNLVIVNHHDLNLCQQYANQIWLLQNGQIVESISTLHSINNEVLASIFGCGIQCAISPTGNKIFQTYLE
ncbi:ATP-binding cassette domain-containing protein [Paraglaciecola sp.]|uniref:ATP-binding cassette domain-containing protein n=1 Tax=Paraglaciecola sp. TaxID=1920173 RepID=UPI0030F3E55E